MTRQWVAIGLAVVFAGSLAACGRYGPPEPYAPEPVEAETDEDERR